MPGRRCAPLGMNHQCLEVLDAVVRWPAVPTAGMLAVAAPAAATPGADATRQASATISATPPSAVRSGFIAPSRLHRHGSTAGWRRVLMRAPQAHLPAPASAPVSSRRCYHGGGVLRGL